MTKREYLTTLKNFIAETDSINDYVEGYSANDFVEFLDKELVLLDKRTEASKAAAERKKAAGDALTEAVLNALTEEFLTIPEITERVSDPEATVAKITYRVSKLAGGGFAEKGEVLIEVEGAKPRRVVGYRKC